ncbi:MAG TPA: phosphoglucosamine mutase [Solirubrobacteraceae bacterium]|jgi:phosphoglucosamine mutase
MSRRLFGTDGVRGAAGEVLTGELALRLGHAVTRDLEREADRPRVLVIRDTRESGPMLEAALAAGVAAAGGDVLLGGVLPTPAAPLLLQRYGFDLAAVISASHNPYGDNGIKFFGGDGFKLTDETEARIEQRLDDPVAGARIGRVDHLHGTEEDYLRALQTRFAKLDLKGRRILLDCANGATHQVAPEIFRRLGADVTVVAAEPDGRNINEGVGSTHVEALDVAGHDAAFAFDGDGDRVLAKDRTGVVVDGDELLALATLHRGAPGVAVTVMTNFGFHAAMREAGVEVATTKVGDRYVLEELRGRGWQLGGEQSGHLIDMGFVPSGDGVAAALLTLEALGSRDLADRGAMEKLPQRLVNVRVADRDAAMASEDLAEAVERESAGLEGRGRVLVRPSGTEQLVRVMVEAPEPDEADDVCRRLVAVVEASS